MKIRDIYAICLITLLTGALYCADTTLAQEGQPKPAPAAPKKATTTRKVASKKKVEPKEVAPPPLEDRLTDHRLAVRRGEQREQTAPYLIEEITVTGIYKSVEGYGAFLRSVNGRTFFAYTGMPFFDGFVEQIDADQVIFAQTLLGGKTKQVVKGYDPNTLRNNAIAAQKEKEDKEKGKKEKKAKKAEPEEGSEEDETDNDE